MSKTQASDILDLAFALGLSTPKITTGYEKRSTVYILTHGTMPVRHTLMIYSFTPLEEAGKKLAQSANLPLAHVPKAIASLKSKHAALV
jgi:hypothetical protein